MNPDQNTGGAPQPPAPADPNTPQPAETPAPAAPAPAPAPAPAAPATPVAEPVSTPTEAAPAPAPVADSTPAAPVPTSAAPTPAAPASAPAPMAPQPQPAMPNQQPGMNTPKGGGKGKLIAIIGGAVALLIVLIVLVLVLFGSSDPLTSTTRISFNGSSMLVPDSYIVADEDDTSITYSTDDTLDDNQYAVGLGSDSLPAGSIAEIRSQFGDDTSPITEGITESIQQSGGDVVSSSVVEYTAEKLVLDMTITGSNDFFEGFSSADMTVYVRYEFRDSGSLAATYFAYVNTESPNQAAVTEIVQSLEIE